MVKTKKHSVVFDETERNSFLKKFQGSKSSKSKKAKKKPEKSKKSAKNLLKKPLSPKTQDFEETKYEDTDTVNNLSVQVTTKTYN
jgi:Nucleolar protein 12 (25kDa)